MDKELFKKIIEEFIKLEIFTDKLSDAGLDIYDTPAYEACGFLFDKLMEAYFTEEGCDWIVWYMFEKRPNPDTIHATDEDGNEICTNIDELWELAKDYLK